MQIRKFREKIGISQLELSERLNVSRTTVTMWELGLSIPRGENLIKLSRIFNCTIDELLKKDE